MCDYSSLLVALALFLKVMVLMLWADLPTSDKGVTPCVSVRVFLRRAPKMYTPTRAPAKPWSAARYAGRQWLSKILTSISTPGARTGCNGARPNRLGIPYRQACWAFSRQGGNRTALWVLNRFRSLPRRRVRSGRRVSPPKRHRTVMASLEALPLKRDRWKRKSY